MKPLPTLSHGSKIAKSLYGGPVRPSWWLLRFDGSCQRNGHPDATGRWAFHIQCDQRRTVTIKAGITVATPVTVNQSEWAGLLHGLREMERQPIRPAGLHIEGDSMLVVQTLAGRWKSKAASLTVLRDEAREIIARIGVEWASTWIPREENEFCDAMTR